MLFEGTLATIPQPDRRTLKAFLIHFFHGRPEESRDSPMLGGCSSNLYDDPDDLLVLHTREPPDRLTTFVQNYFGFLFEVNTLNYTWDGVADNKIGTRHPCCYGRVIYKLCVRKENFDVDLVAEHHPGSPAPDRSNFGPL